VQTDALKLAIREVAFGRTLPADAAAGAFGAIMRGEGSPAQIAALLMGLRVRGETAEEVTGAARALREAMVTVAATDREALVDTCGTGGGTVTTFNVSTAAALVAAGAGVRIAKHGNRSFTSRCGSADVLEALGISLALGPDALASALEEAGIIFMFAPAMHPTKRQVGPVRGELAVPTVMNIVGPLANPAGAARQVVGVADVERLPLIAGALAALGTAHALVVHGEPGLDEISPLGNSRVIEIRDGSVTEWTLDPRDYGVPFGDAGELAGGGPEENARIVTEILAGGGPPAARDAVLLNAAAAIHVSPGAEGRDYAGSLERARESVRSGAGLQALARLRSAYSKRVPRAG
jgi:anthranilate phosphoribosyltransferase